MNIDGLLLYRFPKDGLAYKLSTYIYHSLSGDLSEEDADGFYSCINALIEISSAHGFYGNLWHCYLTYILVSKENAYSLGCEIKEDDGGSVSELAKEDFKIFMELFSFDFAAFEKVFHINLSHITGFEDKNSDGRVFNHRIRDCILDLCVSLESAKDVLEFQKEVALFYKNYGVGSFGLHKAFRVDEKGEIQPISKISHVQFSDLIGYEDQKKRLIENTKAFISEKPANNVLLYGDAGTGKSSSIKACINEFYDKGLRIIEIYKHQFQDLNYVISQIKNRNYKFIIYMDDLSFEEFETEYKYLKAVIEGGIEKKPDNILIYATSNRRHLIRESYSDKLDGDDIHKNDTVQEKLSLYNRFGVAIYYGAPNKNEYLDIVYHLNEKYHLCMDKETLMSEANKWELTHGGYTGRAAKQLIDYLLGKET